MIETYVIYNSRGNFKYYLSYYKIANAKKPLFCFSKRVIDADIRFMSKLSSVMKVYLEFQNRNFIPNNIFNVNGIDPDILNVKWIENSYLFNEYGVRFFKEQIKYYKECLVKKMWEIACNYYNDSSNVPACEFYIDNNNNKYIYCCLGKIAIGVSNDIEFHIYSIISKSAISIEVPRGQAVAGGMITYDNPKERYISYFKELFYQNGLSFQYNERLLTDRYDAWLSGGEVGVYIPLN